MIWSLIKIILFVALVAAMTIVGGSLWYSARLSSALVATDKQRLIAEGCRAILAVGAGSSKSPRLLILRYNGGGSEKPLALVGKGVADPITLTPAYDRDSCMKLSTKV